MPSIISGLSGFYESALRVKRKCYILIDESMHFRIGFLSGGSKGKQTPGGPTIRRNAKSSNMNCAFVVGVTRWLPKEEFYGSVEQLKSTSEQSEKPFSSNSINEIENICTCFLFLFCMLLLQRFWIA